MYEMFKYHQLINLEINPKSRQNHPDKSKDSKSYFGFLLGLFLTKFYEYDNHFLQRYNGMLDQI